MTRDEARKLVSGYATGSLTELEKQLLFDEALDDQELFDELAGEQQVKELMELPGAKRRLLLALGPEKKRVTWMPWAVAFAAAASLAVAVWVQWPAETELRVASVETAPLEPPPAVTQPAPPPAPQEAAAPAAVAVVDAEAKKTEAPPPATEADVIAPPPQATALALADKAKASVREETEPVTAQLEARAQPQLPILLPPLGSTKGAAKGPLRTELAPAKPPLPQPSPPPPQAFVAGTPVASLAARAPVPNTLTYEVRNTGILRMTPSRAGVLEVTFDGRSLYPSRPVAAGVTIDVSIPLEAKQLRIDFANEFNAPNVAAQDAGVSGTLVLPESPNPRSVIVIPALP